MCRLVVPTYILADAYANAHLPFKRMTNVFIRTSANVVRMFYLADLTVLHYCLSGDAA